MEFAGWIFVSVVWVGLLLLLFLDKNLREPLVKIDLQNAPMKIGEKFDSVKAAAWLFEESKRQNAKAPKVAFQTFGTLMYHTEPELFAIEEKKYEATGNCEFVFLSGPKEIHELHFTVENFILMKVSEVINPIDLP